MRYRLFRGPAPDVLRGTFRSEFNQWCNDYRHEQQKGVADQSCDDDYAPIRHAQVAQRHGNVGAHTPEDETM